MIEDEIFKAHVAESMPQWEREYSCYQEKCYPMDHYTSDEKAEFLETIDDPRFDPLEQLKSLISGLGGHESRHNNFRYNWRCKLDPLGGPPAPTFGYSKKRIKDDLGDPPALILVFKSPATPRLLEETDQSVRPVYVHHGYDALDVDACFYVSSAESLPLSQTLAIYFHFANLRNRNIVHRGIFSDDVVCCNGRGSIVRYVCDNL